MKKIIRTSILLISLGFIDYLIWNIISGFSEPDFVPFKVSVLFAIFNAIFLFIIFKFGKQSLLPLPAESENILNTHLNFWIIIPGLFLVGYIGWNLILSLAWGCSFSSGSSCGSGGIWKIIFGFIVIVVILFFISIKRRKN